VIDVNTDMHMAVGAANVAAISHKTQMAGYIGNNEKYFSGFLMSKISDVEAGLLGGINAV